MGLDLPMYKEAYRNIATQIKDLDMPDNKKEIKKLEEIINRNEASIKDWKKGDYESADHSVWFNKEMFDEHENARFEEYAEPYNANISEAQKMIIDLENGMDENQNQLKTNKAKQLELKGYADNARKNAEEDYKKARKEAVEAWENSEEKKQYDSNMETISIINSRRPNLIKAEVEALNRLTGENIKLQQVLGSKLKSLEDEYSQFLQDLAEIDKECGIDSLEKEQEEQKEQESNQEGTVLDEIVETIEKIQQEQEQEKRRKENAGQQENANNGVSNGFKFRQETSGAAAAPIKKLEFKTNKEGILMKVQRTNDYGVEDRKPTPLSKVHEEVNKYEDIDPEILEKASKVGDKFIIDKICSSGYLDTREKEQQLNKYTEMLVEPLTDLRRENLKKEFSIEYDLKGMTREQRKEVEAYAKQAKDLKIAKVDAPRYIKAKWAVQDWVKEHEWAEKAIAGIKSFGNGIRKGIAGLLPAAKEEAEHTTAEVDNEPKEATEKNPKETRVAGVEKVEVNTAEVVNKTQTTEQAQENDIEK